MARLCGVAVDAHEAPGLHVGGGARGHCGLLQFSKLTVGDPTVAIGLELDVIAAVIIGGGSLSGGRGSHPRHRYRRRHHDRHPVGCTQKGLANWVQQIVTGGIIVVAVAIDRVRSQRAA